MIVAAGRGHRAGEGVPKQYRVLGGRSVLARTLDVFLSHDRIDRCVIVIHPDDLDLYRTCVTDWQTLEILSTAARTASNRS